jgi:hypothetical protein
VSIVILICLGLSKSFSPIRDIRQIRSCLDHNTAATIATSLIHYRLDYCNFVIFYRPASHLGRLHFILNATYHAITKPPTFFHSSLFKKSLRWLKIIICLKYSFIFRCYSSSHFFCFSSSLNDLFFLDLLLFYGILCLRNFGSHQVIYLYCNYSSSFSSFTVQFHSKLKNFLFTHLYP